jgi:prepilin-type N-terminal cleavage/methylation domain-containing protein
MRAARGFTLIEMMAVLVLFALLSAIVLPSFQRWYDGLDARVQSNEMAVRLQRLYARTALLSQDFILTAQSARQPLGDGEAAFALPDGWRLADDSALALSATGFCAPASLSLRSRSATLVLHVSEGSCEVRVERGRG